MREGEEIDAMFMMNMAFAGSKEMLAVRSRWKAKLERSADADAPKFPQAVMDMLAQYHAAVSRSES